jgi:hypothetical protein
MVKCVDCVHYIEDDICQHDKVDTWGDPKESSASFQRSLKGFFALWWYRGCGEKGRYFIEYKYTTYVSINKGCV